MGLWTAVVNSCAAMADIIEMTIVSIKGGKKNNIAKKHGIITAAAIIRVFT